MLVNGSTLPVFLTCKFQNWILEDHAYALKYTCKKENVKNWFHLYSSVSFTSDFLSFPQPQEVWQVVFFFPLFSQFYRQYKNKGAVMIKDWNLGHKVLACATPPTLYYTSSNLNERKESGVNTSHLQVWTQDFKSNRFLTVGNLTLQRH